MPTPFTPPPNPPKDKPLMWYDISYKDPIEILAILKAAGYTSEDMVILALLEVAGQISNK